MTIEANSIAASSEPGSPRSRHGWLYGPYVDLFVIVGPWVFLLAMWGVSADNLLLVWFAQFVLGNTTHVVLTFVMLATRRDVLHATPTQAKLVIVGSCVVFLFSFTLLAVVTKVFPRWISFPLAVVSLFGMHHRLSQARGIWSLYNLRGGTLGSPPPPPAEQSFQRHWTSVGLILVATSWLLLPSTPWNTFSLLQPIPLNPAPLPYEVVYLLLALWLAFVGGVLNVLIRNRCRLAKLLHVGTHAAAVSLAILRPVLGSVVWGAIHGLEYYFLCARMMKPRVGDQRRGIPESWVWPVMGISMLPLFIAGLYRAPFASSFFGLTSISTYALHLITAIVATHYFADAFIYRFRIPGVRRVALHRLGFS